MRPSKDEYFMKMLLDVCARSTCGRRSVGAIITTEDGRILSTGYNGPPAGFPHCPDERACGGEGDKPGDSSRCLAVHAEQNAIMQCWRLDLAYKMYVSASPCFTCAKMILQTPIRAVYSLTKYPDLGYNLLVSQEMLYIKDNDEAGAIRLAGPDINFPAFFG